jgi:hydroxymethylpyrimidine/phosphomethylpyrimidine kinase
MRRRRPAVVCSIGSTDPTAAAGLFLDAAAYARIGAVAPSFVVAGVTAQNARGVRAVEAVSPRAIERQLEAIWSQHPPDAVRIGLLPTRAACLRVARFLRALPIHPAIVVDPVMRASSGGRLLEDDALDGLRALVRMATIATPNAAEAAALAGMPDVRTQAQAVDAARAIAARGGAVLVTGGHLETSASVVDVLARGGRIVRFASRRIDVELRGTCCMLACAVAVSLARGRTLVDAVRDGRAFVRAALLRARRELRARRR